MTKPFTKACLANKAGVCVCPPCFETNELLENRLRFCDFEDDGSKKNHSSDLVVKKSNTLVLKQNYNIGIQTAKLGTEAPSHHAGGI